MRSFLRDKVVSVFGCVVGPPARGDHPGGYQSGIDPTTPARTLTLLVGTVVAIVANFADVARRQHHDARPRPRQHDPRGPSATSRWLILLRASPGPCA